MDQTVIPELSANIWPVVDADSGIVQRFLARAYAIDGGDAVISSTLRALAVADFRMAKAFPIPPRFVLTSQFGSMEGAITARGFDDNTLDIVEHALQALTESTAAFQGIDMRSGTPRHSRAESHFADDPYLVVTYLLESESGDLVPQT